jgi:hypothetical protein
MSHRRALPIVLVGCLLAYLGIGVAWTIANLGDVPRYGDSKEYVRLAKTLEVDEYRGIAYPALLALVDRVIGERSILAERRPGAGETARGFRIVQVLQVAIGVVCLAYFLRVVVSLDFLRRTGGHRLEWLGFLLLLMLLLFDPLVSHLNLSILTDGLTLSACLAFLGAVTVLLRGARSWSSGAILLAAHLAAAGLRSEKGLVLLVSSFLTVLLWWLRWRGATDGRPPAIGGRVLSILVITTIAFLGSIVLQSSFLRDRGRWPVHTSILHQRVVFANLSGVYDRLPEDVRRQVSPEQAARIDEHIRYGRGVIKKITGGEPHAAASLVSELHRTVWSERWPAIVADVVKDSAENFLSTISFYVRLAAYAYGGEERFRSWFHSDGTRWTYTRMSLRYPGLTRCHVIASAAVLILIAAFATGGVVKTSRRGFRSLGPDALASIMPLGVFCLVNAVAFAIVADQVHIRYTVLAHVVWLVLFHRFALLRATSIVEAEAIESDPPP